MISRENRHNSLPSRRIGSGLAIGGLLLAACEPAGYEYLTDAANITCEGQMTKVGLNDGMDGTGFTVHHAGARYNISVLQDGSRFSLVTGATEPDSADASLAVVGPTVSDGSDDPDFTVHVADGTFLLDVKPDSQQIVAACYWQ